MAQMKDEGAAPKGAAPASTTASQPKPAPASASATTTRTLTDAELDRVLAQKVGSKGGKFNYKDSIVDLLRLFDIDSSLAFRTKLAGRLGVNAGPHGSAEQNIALHKEVMKRIAQNGGLVPDVVKG